MANQDLNPSSGVQGSSFLYNMGTTPNTRTVISQRVRILTPAYGSQQKTLLQTGVLSNLGVNQSRGIETMRGIGFGDKVAELVPGVTEPTQLSFERTMLYLANLWQAFGYAGGSSGPVRSLAHHRWPFDVEEQVAMSTLVDVDLSGQSGVGLSGTSGTFDGGIKALKFPAVTNDPNSNPGDLREHTAIITMYEACWFTSYGKTYNKDSAAVMETGDGQATDTHDFSSEYGEFLATGNDPTIGQLGSVRFTGAAQTGGTPFVT